MYLVSCHHLACHTSGRAVTRTTRTPSVCVVGCLPISRAQVENRTVLYAFDQRSEGL